MADRAVIVDLREWQDYARRMRAGPAIVADETETALDRGALLVQGSAREAAPVFQGVLRNSIAIEAFPRQREVGSNQPHAETVEKGRTPGKPMPPRGALLRWIAFKGLQPAAGQTLEQLEYLIRRKIGRSGTAPQPYLFPALEQHRGRIVKEFELAMARAWKRIVG